MKKYLRYQDHLTVEKPILSVSSDISTGSNQPASYIMTRERREKPHSYLRLNDDGTYEQIQSDKDLPCVYYIDPNRDKLELPYQPLQVQDSVGIQKQRKDTLTRRVNETLTQTNELNQDELRMLRFFPNKLRLMVYNVFGFGVYKGERSVNTYSNLELGNNILAGFQNITSTHKPDILCLQELPREFLTLLYPHLRATYSYYTLCKSSGLQNGILLNKTYDSITSNLKYKSQTSHSLSRNRCMTMYNLALKDARGKKPNFIVVSLHLELSSFQQRQIEINRVFGYLSPYVRTSNIIILGDFNCDYTELKGHAEPNGYIITDDKHKANLESKGVSIPDKAKERMITSYQGGSRTDWILVNKDFEYKILGIYKIFSQVSDHAPIVIDIEKP